MKAAGHLEDHFAIFRQHIIGQDQVFETPFGTKKLIYADWTASGRAYAPIESCLRNEVMPYFANTHTGTTVTGRLMSEAYEEAKHVIREHVNADANDVLIFCGSGMTAAVNKLQRILGLRIPERIKDYLNAENVVQIDEHLRPVVFITHMEHHSNHISWLETIAEVEIISSEKNGNVDLEHFKALLERFRDRKNKIAAVTACSNVTGIETPYHEIARLIHEQGGLCFVDFACSAPYATMDLHPADAGAHLDAVYFSPHKFLGGPGTPGILIFNKRLYVNSVPDQPGGGTVMYSNPWKIHDYIPDIELREDGGTPPILQGIKAAMCIRLKEAMGLEHIKAREEELLRFVFERFAMMDNVKVFARDIQQRIGIISFMITGAHYNLVVKILNDRFGIQTRGGCACAGTYGHLLLGVDRELSCDIREAIHVRDLSSKPGWARLSVHPTMTDTEIRFIMDAIEETALNFGQWGNDYTYDVFTNEFYFSEQKAGSSNPVENWFNKSLWNQPEPISKISLPEYIA